MKSVEGYTPQDAVDPSDGPWPEVPASGPSPTPSPEMRAAEEALEAALAEVSRVEDELRSMEEVRERLQGQLQHASAQADGLISQIAEVYSRERERLEAELQLVQRRASGLEQIREIRLGKAETPGVASAPAATVEAAAPQVPAPAELAAEPVEAASPVAVVAAEQPAEAKRTDRKTRKRADTSANGEGEGAEAAYEDHWYQVLKRDNNLGAEPS
jgi:hypothetical protein